jgi:hypothetical protein
MTLRNCPACTERFPLQHGEHHLPDGSAMACAGRGRRTKQQDPIIRSKSQHRIEGCAGIVELFARRVPS